MKILFITPLLPHPSVDHASAFCEHKMIRYLSKKHDVSLISFVRSDEERKLSRDMLEFCRRVETVRPPGGALRKLWVRANLLTLTPMSMSHGRCREMRNMIRSIVRQDEFDIVQMEYPTMAQYISEIGNSATVIHLPDLMYEKARNLSANLSLSRKKLEWLADSFICRRYEKKLYAKFDLILTISPKIRESLLSCNPALDVSVLPIGVDIPKGQETSPYGRGRNLVFMGAMWRPENIDAVMYFYRSVFGLVRETIPDVTLHIVGGSPSEEIRKLTSDPGVRVTGYVEDLPSFYTRCDVSIAPIRMSGGVHCKILDAMASGLPVITTTGGNEGIGATPNKEIIIADSTEDFARYTVELLEDGDRRKSVGLGGLEYVRRNFGWKEIIGRLESLYKGCLSSE